MTSLSNIRDWLRKHWAVFHRRPANGERALAEIEPILQEMRENNNRVRNAVDHMVEETAAGDDFNAVDIWTVKKQRPVKG